MRCLDFKLAGEEFDNKSKALLCVRVADRKVEERKAPTLKEFTAITRRLKPRVQK